MYSISRQSSTHTIWTRLKNPCITCLSLSLGRGSNCAMLSLGPGTTVEPSDKNCVRLSFTFVFPATLKRWSLPGSRANLLKMTKIWGKFSEMTLLISGQAAFRSKTVAFAFDFRVFFRQLLCLVNGFSQTRAGRNNVDRCWSVCSRSCQCGWCTVCRRHAPSCVHHWPKQAAPILWQSSAEISNRINGNGHNDTKAP